jgi:hypothetical protein
MKSTTFRCKSTTGSEKQHSTISLIVDHYTSVSDSLLILEFLASWGSCH